ncbi:MAG: hypothetical protein Q8R00_00175 [Candidatus Nanoarchaeia archaeon]|nr:hypothetical protein [Candidatus Nanoarchaeia archaeon]
MTETKLIYNPSLPQALRQTQEWAGKGYVASLPQLIDLRLKSDTNSDFWTKGFATTTEEHVGKTKLGNSVLVTSHRTKIWTPERIEQAYNQGLINGAGKLEEPEFYTLLDTDVQVTDLDKVQKLPSGRQSLDTLRKDTLFILRAGSEERANQYLDKLSEADYLEYGNFHSLIEVNPDQPQGRLLFVDDYYNGFYDYGHLYGFGQFVGVRQAQNFSTGNLERILALRKFVPEILHKDFEAEAKKVLEEK